jgi:hypothetical protein
MKKMVFAIATMFLISCGGSDSKQIEATYSDTPGPDSSVILPALVDSSLTASDTNTAHIKSDDGN